MSAEIKPFPLIKCKIRYCPGCGWQIKQDQAEGLLYDLACARCRRHKISEFRTLGT